MACKGELPEEEKSDHDTSMSYAYDRFSLEPRVAFASSCLNLTTVKARFQACSNAASGFGVRL